MCSSLLDFEVCLSLSVTSNNAGPWLRSNIYLKTRVESLPYIIYWASCGGFKCDFVSEFGHTLLPKTKNIFLNQIEPKKKKKKSFLIKLISEHRIGKFKILNVRIKIVGFCF